MAEKKTAKKTIETPETKPVVLETPIKDEGKVKVRFKRNIINLNARNGAWEKGTVAEVRKGIAEFLVKNGDAEKC